MGASPAHDDADTERRLYFRMKQREHRMKNRSKRSKMMQRVHELEETLRRAKMNVLSRQRATTSQVRGDLLLPWHVIADVMKAELDVSEACQVILRNRIDVSVALIQDMQRFTTLHDTFRQPSWRHVTLFANPESRRLGKRWITEHMYRNKRAMFQQFSFPPLQSNERVQEYDLVYTANECYFLIQRSHLTFDVPMEALRQMNHRHLCSLLLLAGSSHMDHAVCTISTSIARKTKWILSRSTRLTCAFKLPPWASASTWYWGNFSMPTSAPT
ncbi:hypothetical protein, variant [Aphanomyces invadans]|uniref:Uncharacterized protein n=1 Tax=Aphanomyces invadans TaxID=157072 RepID=A0A024TCY9_9STRA|nr:hypothetical protein, variant [Aphanomyces invadans]ETV91227.1 hypothetical protein, variant [Aphanomyces invadans]|eukprot:XP_008880064.1 hypothetical protein, variant [Aphanomyces invadans]